MGRSERVDAETASQQLGHSAPAITREFYISKPAIAADVAHVLDELGFQASGSPGGDYGGSPLNAHYVQFEETLKQLGASREQILGYKPSESAVAIRRMIESSYQDYPLLVSLLASVVLTVVVNLLIRAL